jgi:hypothetical protein
MEVPGTGGLSCSWEAGMQLLSFWDLCRWESGCGVHFFLLLGHGAGLSIDGLGSELSLRHGILFPRPEGMSDSGRLRINYYEASLAGCRGILQE